MKKYGTTGSRGAKDAFDKFYTNPDLAKSLLARVDIESYDVCVEPSAGSGAFSSLIPGCLAYDIRPEGPGVIEADWFSVDKGQFLFQKVLVFGNPPFGRSGSLALRFIQESALFADTIAFVLPRGFKKESTKKRFPQYFHLIHEEDVPDSSFLLNNEPYSVPCVFQIWVRRGEKRPVKKRGFVSEHLKFVTKDLADFRIQRVGGNAGRATTDMEIAAAASNYFVQNVSNFSTPDLIDIINSLVFPSIDHTTGPRSLPKQELVSILEKRLK